MKKYKAVKNFSANGVKKKAGELIKDSELEKIGKFESDLLKRGLIIQTSEQDKIVKFKGKTFNLTKMDYVDLEKLARKSEANYDVVIKDGVEELRKKIYEKLTPKTKELSKDANKENSKDKKGK